MSRSWDFFLRDILESAQKVHRYTQALNMEAFVQDEIIYDAVLRNLEIIGEAAKKIPSEIRDRYPQIDWRRMAGLRDVLAHTYFGLDDETLWNIIREKVPQLIFVLREVSNRDDVAGK